MSFSSNVKEELSKLENLKNKQNVKKELIGYLLSSNTTRNKTRIKFSTESEYNINRFAKLLNNTQILGYDIEVQDKNYIIEFKENELVESSEDLKISSINNKQTEDPIRALIRGVFLGAGSISNPEKTYHVSMGLNKEQDAEKIKDILEDNNIRVKIIKKKNSYHIYTKDGEEISKFLAFIGANKAVLEFETIRVEREMKNKINRIVNCEEANLNKTMNASIEQIEAIQKLKKSSKYQQLDENLKEIAEIRLKNPNASLLQIGKMLRNPIGKSGVNYRLSKIVNLAKEI